MKKLAISFFALLTLGIGCKTKPMPKTTSTEKSDSINSNVTKKTFQFDSINTKPTAKFNIQAELDFDSNGLKPFVINQVLGTDTVKIIGEGRTLKAEVTCWECENRYQFISERYDSLLAVKQKKEKAEVIQVPVETPYIPWYIYLVIVSLIVIIILLVKK